MTTEQILTWVLIGFIGLVLLVIIGYVLYIFVIKTGTGPGSSSSPVPPPITPIPETIQLTLLSTQIGFSVTNQSSEPSSPFFSFQSDLGGDIGMSDPLKFVSFVFQTVTGVSGHYTIQFETNILVDSIGIKMNLDTQTDQTIQNTNLSVNQTFDLPPVDIVTVFFTMPTSTTLQFFKLSSLKLLFVPI